MCERRLLRGEQPDLFLDAGQPRMVCELCAPRAAHQGWKRGSAELSTSAAPLRSRRGRGLFERLRGARQAEREQRRRRSATRRAYARRRRRRPSPYDFLTVDAIAGAPTAPACRPRRSTRAPARLRPARPRRRAAAGGASPCSTPASTRAVSRASTRSLGAPEVSVRPGEAVASSVVIVLAWELCWYTYEVDLDDMQGPSRARSRRAPSSPNWARGPAGERVADERGALALL